MKNEPIYNTKQIAEMFQVATSTIFYWKKHGKLVEYTKDKNGQKLFRQSDIISFIKRTNNGDYAPSSIDVFYALDYMGLKNVIEHSIPFRNKYKTQYEIRIPDDNSHVITDRMDYIKIVSLMKFNTN